MTYDAVIIGGGLGGLTAGAKLAKAGRRVLLVEQHAVVGGCATTFRRKDFTVEVGLHEMDGPVPGDIKTEIFADLGIRQHVKMARVPEFYRFVNGRLDVVVPDDARAAELALIERFPHEARGIRRFFKTILRIRREIRRIPHGWKMLLALQPDRRPPRPAIQGAGRHLHGRSPRGLGGAGPRDVPRAQGRGGADAARAAGAARPRDR